ncbi:endonuclease/exonuclease/phosphatase family protein [Iamia sp. SCSIO 61187]|uniref:endonuclease/exonuclease/phosphatase family protein n=1 Tax=Iamia sp. SCSIO 61187 TaxID=2722752 RepID=UPI001C639F5D|nr:endonuclease/exonuclease/phosphatase family protein [Iamia sp. SCSIO 61187]QYG92377.1 endonuclease/exonuclease/phosphatase family protein [Iamia sp. SCSIO 61187]
MPAEQRGRRAPDAVPRRSPPPSLPSPDPERPWPTRVTARRAWITLSSALPLLPRSPSPPTRVGDGVTFTVVAANLERGQRDPVAQAEALAALDADVLLLTEHAAATRAALEEAGLASTFPHQADDPSEWYFGSLVASRRPLLAADRRDLGGRPGQVVDIDVAGIPVRLVPVHTQAPVHDRDVVTWHDGLVANTGIGDDAPGPVILAGDWNATGGHGAFRRALSRHDLVDASAVLGHRWYPTWPVDQPVYRLPLPPFLTLDHVVVSAGVEVVALERLALPGSDHRGLRATLRLPR